MMHTKTTTKINIRISHAEDALEKLFHTPVSESSEKERAEFVNIIQLVLKVCEHKLLRLEDLESQVAHFKAKTSMLELSKNVDLVTHAVELEAELTAAKERIAKLEAYVHSIVGIEEDPTESLQETGTD